ACASADSAVARQLDSGNTPGSRGPVSRAADNGEKTEPYVRADESRQSILRRRADMSLIRRTRRSLYVRRANRRLDHHLRIDLPHTRSVLRIGFPAARADLSPADTGGSAFLR